MDRSWKQMCWGFKVICNVSANLVRRMVSETLDSGYKMGTICCGRPVETYDDYDVEYELIKETTESFYKENVSREMAERLLKNKQNGTFIIRPSKCSKLGTLSVVQDDRVYHLTIRRRVTDNWVALGKEKNEEKCFRTVTTMIDYYVSNYLILYSNGHTKLTLLLPHRD